MYKMTEDHKRKIGEANKRGKFIKCKNCGKKVWASPYELKRKDPKRYCGINCFREYYRKNFAKKGKENRFWKNGTLAYLKKIVLKRDNWSCRKCGFRDKEIMQVDHKKEKYCGGTDELSNLQTLCPNCHAKKTYRFLRNRRK